MYLSNRDIQEAINRGSLIFRPDPPNAQIVYGETSIDLHLDSIDKGARVWDIASVRADHMISGIDEPEIRLGKFDYPRLFEEYLVSIPIERKSDPTQKVFRRGDHVIVRPEGFLLWSTNEWVGTPKEKAEFICFVNAKSTKARTGIVVHLSAPTIHAGWEGVITLEIVNFGPFSFVLAEGDAISQLTVATISGPPDFEIKTEESTTNKQSDPGGGAS